MNPVFSKTKNVRTTILSKFPICGTKKSKFIKEKEAKGLLTSLGFKTELDKILVFEDYLL